MNMETDEKREGFILATANAMLMAFGLADVDPADVCAWLRTVWLEARGEKWGANAEGENE